MRLCARFVIYENESKAPRLRTVNAKTKAYKIQSVFYVYSTILRNPKRLRNAHKNSTK